MERNKGLKDQAACFFINKKFISKNILTLDSMIRTVRVSDKGQIAIPKPIRKIMGINKGDELTLVQMDGKLLIEKSQKTEVKMKDEFRDIIKFSEKSLKEVWNNKEDEIWNKYLK